MCLGSSYADPDADQDDSKVSDEDENDCDSEENIRKELTRLISMVRYLLPVVGQSVEVIKLGCCPGLTNGLVSLFYSHHYLWAVFYNNQVWFSHTISLVATIVYLKLCFSDEDSQYNRNTVGMTGMTDKKSK